MSQNRLSKLVSHLTPSTTSAESNYIKDYRTELQKCSVELRDFINKLNCNPILVRLAWHDSGTFDNTIKRFPECGGANGSIRFKKELNHGANAGLFKAINYLKKFKNKYPMISWSDLIQLSSVISIELSGGPIIPIKYGRIDIKNENECPNEGNLPAANPPFDDGSPDAATHLRRVFYRMGFNDQEIVVLSGAHTLGRAFKERSGTVNEGYGSKKGTKFTKQNSNIARSDGKKGLGMEGGRSWTRNWLTFDNQYYNFEKLNNSDKSELLRLSTDKVIFVDPIFKKWCKYYGENQSKFFDDYVKAHQKLASLGSKFRPIQGFYL